MNIKPIIPDLPNDSDIQVVGYLYDLEDKSCLGEDMLDVQLPNGILISAGWHPEGSDTGEFRIDVTKKFDHLESRKAFCVDDAKSIVEFLVKSYLSA